MGDATGAGFDASGMTPFEQSSAAQNLAYAGGQNAMMLNAAGPQGGTYQAQGYDPSTYNAQGYQGQGYQGQGYTGQGYDAATAAGPDRIASGIDTYLNPYTDQVIGRTTDNMMRQNAMAQNTNAAAANAAGAFGGSRHGVVEAMTNAETNRNVGDMAANLRHQGWNTAAGLSGQDIANQQANSQFNAAALNQAGQFNAGASNAANQFSAAANNAANQYTAGANNAANQWSAGAQNQAAASNANALNTAGQFGAAAQNAAGQFNAGQNQNAWQSQISNQLSLGNQMSNLGQQSFGYGQNLLDMQEGQGDKAQQTTQNFYDAAAQIFDGNSPEAVVNQLFQSLSGSPSSGSSTTTGTSTPSGAEKAALIWGTVGDAMGK